MCPVNRAVIGVHIWKLGEEWVPQVQEMEQARVAGAKWESLGPQEKRPEKSAAETMEGLRAVAGVWLLFFMSEQLLEGFEQS